MIDDEDEKEWQANLRKAKQEAATRTAAWDEAKERERARLAKMRTHETPPCESP